MDTSALRQAKHAIQPQRLPYHKKAQSQTTIDLYVKPVANARQGKNDIRNYFPPVAKTKVVQSSECTKSSSVAEMRAISRREHDNDGAIEPQTSGPSPSAAVPLEKSTISLSDDPRPGKTAPGVAVRPRNHTHANSALLPDFDPFFDDADFPHSTSLMAPRVTDVMRHSLLPKPLNIKTPLPPAAENSVSPSQITSSPSSAGDADIASFDEGYREAPSFKQTYVGVHSRHNMNEDPLSPLMALRDSSLRPLHQRVERPGALRSKTTPLFSEQGCADSVIYFLPQVSPTSESEAEEKKDLKKSRYLKPVKKAKAERQVSGLEEGSLSKMGKKGDVAGQNAVAISPGLQRYYDYLASQKNVVPGKEGKKNGEILNRKQREDEAQSLDSSDHVSSGKKKKKKGKRFLRLIEAYSRHVEGLQMIQ